MDRYEFDIKIEQIKKLMKKKDFATAVKIADSIEWKKVKENPLLIIAADVYEVSGKYDEAREVLLLAYEKTGLGRQLAYRLCRLSVKRGDFNEAEEFYDEFTHNSPYDAGKYILQYEMAKGKGESLETQISILETFIGEDMDDRWAFELAKLYHKAHLAEKCVELCDTIILWFADGKYVEKALELKQLYVPLSENQRIKYEAQKSKKDRMVAEAVQNLVDGVSTEQPQETEKVEEVSEVSSEAAEVVEEVSSDEVEVSSESEPVVEQEDQAEEILDQVHEMDIDVNSIQVKDFSKSNQYDTINIQKELAKSVSTLFDNTVEIFKPVAPKTTVDEEQVDDQIEGQMSLEEVLAMFESGEIQTRSEDEQEIEETLIEETSIEETPIEEVSEEDVVDVEEIFEEEIPETEEIDEMETLSQIIAEDIQEEIEEEILDEIEEVKEEENNLSMFNLKEDLEDEEPFEETLDEEIIEETED
ncbi:MAG: tetratricopeptide repeat protein, partial [Lachnospiraceae bacterium]|nr:tetratricopeptide repeat protein [Lachnospiraceae bacterium]